MSAPDIGPAQDQTPLAVASDPWWFDTFQFASENWEYALVALLTVLVAYKAATAIRRRITGGDETEPGKLTRADRAITRLTALIATGVLATGMWSFFSDVLGLHWTLQTVLFAFAEFQIIAAFRRVRRHIYRHGTLGHGVRTIYGIAAGSAFLASVHAGAFDEGAFRWYVAGVAAYMVVDELSEELDIWLTEHPDKRPEGTRKPGQIHWALTPERVLVWLRLAEPTSRGIEDVAKARRLARLARTAYRLHTLTETEAAPWKVRRAARSLRRQAESANEHLSLGTDPAAIRAVRENLALLYQVQDATTRAAVGDVSVWGHGHRTAIADKSAVVHTDTLPDGRTVDIVDNQIVGLGRTVSMDKDTTAVLSGVLDMSPAKDMDMTEDIGDVVQSVSMDKPVSARTRGTWDKDEAWRLFADTLMSNDQIARAVSADKSKPIHVRTIRRERAKYRAAHGLPA